MLDKLTFLKYQQISKYRNLDYFCNLNEFIFFLKHMKTVEFLESYLTTSQ